METSKQPSSAAAAAAAEVSVFASVAGGKPPAHTTTATNKMADMKNKFMSWTMNVIKETAAVSTLPGENLYGVGVELALAQPRVGDGEVQQQERKFHQEVVIIINSLHPNGPAAKMGLQKGDVVLQVDTTELNYDQRVYTPSDVAQLVRGPSGSFVDVVIERRERGEITQKEFRLRREPIIGMRGRRMLNSTAPVGGGDDAPTAAGVGAAETSKSASAISKRSSSNENINKAKAPTQNMLDRLDSVLNEEPTGRSGRATGSTRPSGPAP